MKPAGGLKPYSCLIVVKFHECDTKSSAVAEKQAFAACGLSRRHHLRRNKLTSRGRRRRHPNLRAANRSSILLSGGGTVRKPAPCRVRRPTSSRRAWRGR